MVHEHLDFPFAMTVNIPFVDTSVDNGATEFWLGTHFRGNKGIKDPTLDGPWIAPEYLENRRAECPPIRPAISKGSLVIRDVRLWHAGIANETSIPRIMLGLVNATRIKLMKGHYASWYGNPMRVKLPESSRTRVDGWDKDIRIMAEYIPDAEYNHLTLQHNVTQAGGNREMTAQEVAYTKKYGTAVQRFDSMK